MRIAVVNNFFPPRVGGSSHLSESLAKAYRSEGHDVLVLTAEYGDASRREQRDGMDIVRFNAWTLPRFGTSIDFDVTFTFGPRNLQKLFRVLDEFRPDVLHLHGQFLDLSWLASVYASRRKCPVLLSVHTRLEGTTPGCDRVFRLLDAVVVRPIIALGRPRYVVMDTLMERYISSRYRALSSQMIAIPVGVDTDREVVHGDGRAIRTKLGIGDRPMILSIGHVIPLRDRVTLVEALPLILRRHPDAVLVVVGDVNYPAFLDRARELGITDKVICTGAVPRGEIQAYLDAASVESHDLQGFGLGTASLEAMLAEVPIVAAVSHDNFPGIELRNDENITLVPIGDAVALSGAICGLLDDPTTARRIAKEQRVLVETNFSMKSVVDAHLRELALLSRERSTNR